MVVVGGCRDEAAPAVGHEDHAGHAHTRPAAVPSADDHADHDHGPGEHQDGGDDRAVTGADWCAEHGVPESQCTRCNSALIAAFKAEGDWCAGHDLPESQCIRCNPELKAKFRAMAPKPAISPANTIATAPAGGLTSGDEFAALGIQGPAFNDPMCTVEQERIRLASPEVAKHAGLEAAPAARRTMSAFIECPGQLEYNQNVLAHVSPRVSGSLVEVKARLGDHVEAGAILATIDSPDLGEARSRYIQAREDFTLAEAEHKRVIAISQDSRALLELYTPTIKAEELQRKATELRIGEAKGRLLAAHAGLELARVSFERESRLREQQLGSEKAFEEARHDLSAAQAQFQATREAVLFEDERNRLSAERGLRVARGTLDAARRALLILGLSTEDITALDKGTEEGLSRYLVRAPLAGRIVDGHAVTGEYVSPENTVFTIADTSTMWAMLHVSQGDALRLSPGQRVTFIPEGAPEGQGTIAWISDQADQRTRTVQVRAELPNTDGRLRANIYGTGRIVILDNRDVLAIPRAAVQTDGCCRLVFVREAAGVYAPRKVVLGTASGSAVEVIEGLSEGDPVVTTGSFLLKTEILKGSLGAGCCEVDPGR